MTPKARREAIVDAILPLFAEQGAGVTTRQMAEAACVAEGTLFSVFPDKRAILVEAVRVTVDPQPLREALEGLDPEGKFEDQLIEAAEIVRTRLQAVMSIMHLFHLAVDPHDAPDRVPEFLEQASAGALEALTRFFERHASHLRMEPRRAAIAFRGLVLAACLPSAAFERPDLSEVVDILARGMTRVENSA